MSRRTGFTGWRGGGVVGKTTNSQVGSQSGDSSRQGSCLLVGQLLLPDILRDEGQHSLWDAGDSDLPSAIHKLPMFDTQ